MSNISFTIKKQLGAIGEGTKGWSKQLNLISWNGREPKYDIRDWDSTMDKMGKGVTLTLDELKALKDVLNSIDI
jgi:hypothetical protein